MQNRTEPASEFFLPFVQMTLRVLAGIGAADFEATVVNTNDKKVVQIQGIPAGKAHAKAVCEKLSQFDLARGPIFVAFRAYGELGRIYVGEVWHKEFYFVAIDSVGQSPQVRACVMPLYWTLVPPIE